MAKGHPKVGLAPIGFAVDKPSSGYRFGYRFRVGPYRFCSDGNPTTLSILLWSYLILSDTLTLLFGIAFSDWKESWKLTNHCEICEAHHVGILGHECGALDFLIEISVSVWRHPNIIIIIVVVVVIIIIIIIIVIIIVTIIMISYAYIPVYIYIDFFCVSYPEILLKKNVIHHHCQPIECIQTWIFGFLPTNVCHFQPSGPASAKNWPKVGRIA